MFSKVREGLLRRVKAVIFLLVYLDYLELDYLEFSRDVDYGLYVFCFRLRIRIISGKFIKKLFFLVDKTLVQCYITYCADWLN